MRIKITIACLLNLLVFTMVLACGYRIMGSGGEFPEGVTTLSISSLKNETLEPRLDKIFVSAFRKEFISRRDVGIVEIREAESILQGTIQSLTTSSLSYDEEGRAKEHRIIITIDLLVVRQEDGKILWQGNGIRGSEVYKASSDVMVNEGRKNRAIRKIAAELAEEVYLRIQEGF